MTDNVNPPKMAILFFIIVLPVFQVLFLRVRDCSQNAKLPLETEMRNPFHLEANGLDSCEGVHKKKQCFCLFLIFTLYKLDITKSLFCGFVGLSVNFIVCI